MKNRIGLLLLILVCIGLAVTLVIRHKRGAERERLDAEKIATLSNHWVETSSTLEDQRSAATLLEKDLTQARRVMTDLTNSYALVSANLAQVNANLAKTEANLKLTEEEVKKRDARIAELEGQNQALDKQALDLSGAITNLTIQIADTQRKLNASEGDKAFLQKELKRLMAEKAELERQFNDLAVLRAQVSHLKEELSIARRIEWIRRGLLAGTEEKGATKLMQMNQPRPPSMPPSQSGALNVEISSGGTVRVVTGGTNAPSTNAPSSGTNAPPK